MLELIKIGTDFATGKPVFEILGMLKSHETEGHFALLRATPDYIDVFEPVALFKDAIVGEISGSPVYDLNGLYGVITGNLWAAGLPLEYPDPEVFCNEIATCIIAEKFQQETRPFYIVELD